ncbi:hypothetical protein ACFPYN_03045 [Paenisporosarcina macmurdoensis]|uniref:Phage gp6-like head-tail connector protein n=1 Tax=Paenisporosarcina macmurdoensis TaxID=212659 RepID=A0ABW1L3U4_9BACL
MDFLTDLKGRLNVTWSDDDQDLIKIIERSKAYFNDIVGSELEFVDDLVVQELLLERCRYVFNNAADDFLINFSDDLMRLRMRVAIKLRGEANVEII